jgi:hypothetical protein
MNPVVQSRNRYGAGRKLMASSRVPASFWNVLQNPLPDLSLGGMFRRLPALSLVCAWLCASGALLDMAQVLAWTRMFAGYARTESVVAAARETFDPAKPCALCCAVSKAREASRPQAPAVAGAGSEKLLLICEQPLPFVAASDRRSWPERASSRAVIRVGEVPVPPPRAVSA